MGAQAVWNVFLLIVVVTLLVAAVLLFRWSRVAEHEAWLDRRRDARWSADVRIFHGDTTIVYLHRTARLGRRVEELETEEFAVMEGDPDFDPLFWRARVDDELAMARKEADRRNVKLLR